MTKVKTNLGRVIPVHRGEWDPSGETTYEKLDIVNFDESCLICIVTPTTNQDPDDNTYWKYLCKSPYRLWKESAPENADKTKEEYLVSLVGKDGAALPGEFSKSSTHIIWKVEGGDTWVDIVPLTEITGPKGDTPEIVNDYWWISGQNTNIRAKAEDGQPGDTPTIVGGYWWIGGSNTNIKAVGVDGTDGESLTWESLTPEQQQEIKDDIGQGTYDPLVHITDEEKKIGTIKLFGTTYDLFQMLVEITDNIPVIADAEATFVLSDIPIGFNLFLDVKSFIAAADSQVIVADYYNHLYKIQRIFVDTDLATKITIKCLETIPVDVKINLQVQYIKDPGDILELNITVPTGIDPEDVNLTFPPLKYNKQNVASLSVDDSKPTWNSIFSPIHRKWVDNEQKNDLGFTDGGNIVIHKDWTETINGRRYDRSTNYTVDGVPLNGKIYDDFCEYTDGAGIRHRYGFSLAGSWWWFAKADEYPDPTTPAYLVWARDAQMSYSHTATSAPEMRYMQDFGVSYEMHDMYIPDTQGKTNYNSMTQAEFDAAVVYEQEKIFALIDRKPKIGTRPGGNDIYCRFVDCPYVQFTYMAVNQDGFEGLYGHFFRPFFDTEPLSKSFIPFREFWNEDIYKVDAFKAKVISEYEKPLADRVWNIYGVHDAYSMYIEHLPPNNNYSVEELLQSLAASYGKNGDDSLWFTSNEEVMEYSHMRRYASIGKQVSGQTIKFKIHVPFVKDFWFKSISCMLSGISSLTGVSVSSSDNCKGMSHAINDSQLLVNLDFNADLLAKVEKYVALFENTPPVIGAFTDAEKIGALEDAQYFIQLIKPELRAPFQARLDALAAAPTLASILINANAATTYSRTVAITCSMSGSASQMMVSENSDFSGASWETYASPKSFLLSSGFATKTVYVKIKNANGESTTRSDSIAYSEEAVVLSAISINAGAASSSNQSVNVGFSYTGTPTHYMLSESPTFIGASWVAFAENPAFNLSTGFGSKTVYAKLKNASSESASRNDSIEYVNPNVLSLNSVSLNDGAAETGARLVDVDLSYTGTATQYRLGETADLSAVAWTDIPAGQIQFTVSASYGSKTVYAQVKNDTETSSVVNDSITYVQSVALTAVSINSGAASTDNRTVSVGLTYTGTPTHYRIGEVADLSAVSWVAFTSSPLSYQVADGAGTKTIYVQLKNSVSESDVQHDDITLTVAPPEAVKAVLSLSYDYGNGDLQYATVGALTYNKTQANSGSTTNYLIDKLLKSTTGTDLTGWYFIHDAAHYPAVSGETDLTESGLESTGLTISGNAGVYPDVCINRQNVTTMTVSATHKSRMVFTLPVGSYTFKMIMRVSSGYEVSETTRPYCFYKVVANGVATDPVVVGPSGFTGLGNVNFNAELSFDVTSATDGNVIFWIWNDMPGGEGYRPGINLIEITKTT